jgi:hypothetical protein
MLLNSISRRRQHRVMAPLLATATLTAIGVFGAELSAWAATPGAVTVTLTAPVQTTGSATVASLTCTVKSKTYTVTFNNAELDNGLTLSGKASVRNYKGAGKYTADLAVWASSDPTKGGGVSRKVPVQINTTGGTGTFSFTGTGQAVKRAAGQEIAGSLVWTCPKA